MLFGKPIAQAKDGEDTLTVREHLGERVFLCNGVVLSRLRGNTIYTGSYWDYLLPLPVLYPNPHVLVIGLGGGTIPFQMERTYGSSINIDVVEKSSKVAELSKAFLPQKLAARIIIDDGAAFVAKAPPGTYDVIIVDPYKTYALPKEFASQEFIDSAARALSDRGILAFNYILDPSTTALMQEGMASLKRRFGVYMMTAPRASGNRILLCSRVLTAQDISESASERFPDKRGAARVLAEYASMRAFP